MDRETQRLAQQSVLDGGKTKKERNQLGQFATPTSLARELMAYALTMMPASEQVRFLDPAIGTGSFYSALLSVVAPNRIDDAQGFEVDPHYGLPAQALWADTSLRVQIADFTTQPSKSGSINLLVSNPPYVRHHHLSGETKSRLHAASATAAGMRLSGLAGLYCHFMALSHPWMAPGGLACWLVPSEFMDVNYGREVKRYLLERVTLLRIHRFDPNDAQFDDALVSSAVVWFRNEPPKVDSKVNFTYGGTHFNPRESRALSLVELAAESKWTRFPRHAVRTDAIDRPRLRDLFEIKRGIATGDNHFFILSPERIEALGLPWEQMTPILPSPRYLVSDQINSDEQGRPIVQRPLFLLDCRMSEESIRDQYPTLWNYLEGGRESMLKRYLCRARTPWYVQESRAPAPLLCTYMGRGDRESGGPFRFILNRSRAVVANTYLNLYPKPHVARKLVEELGLIEKVWECLNNLDPSTLTAEGRVYGGGLHKMEPKELAQVPADELATLLGFARSMQLDLAA